MNALRFGAFELRLHERSLLKEGEPTAIGSRAFDVLAALIERRNRIATKEELLSTVWRGLVVEEGNLTVQISYLRKILGRGAIATITGYGYRFTQPVQVTPVDERPLPGILIAGDIAAGADRAEGVAFATNGHDGPTGFAADITADITAGFTADLAAGPVANLTADQTAAPGASAGAAPPSASPASPARAAATVAAATRQTDRRRTNLPARLEPIYGRQTDIEQLLALCRAAHLVTICGPGGIGKTSLAAAVARELVDEQAHGAWVIEFAAVRDPRLVVSTVAQRIGVSLAGLTPSAEALAALLRERQALLVLDNCEHLLAEIAKVAEALNAAAPGIRILATSQEPLKVRGECLHRLATLAVPRAGAAFKPESYGAVQLFIERVRSQQPAVSYGKAELADIATICRQLDGIALAIELAAARVPFLGVSGVLSLLGSSPRLLASRTPVGGRRHQTMRAALEWSCSLLDAPMRVVIRRLGVFTGGFSLEAATRVVGDTELEIDEAFDTLAVLVDRSLLLVDSRHDRARYRMLEPMREYALEQLEAAGERDAWNRRHAEATRDICRMAVRERDNAWLWSELNNARVALEWALNTPGEGDIAITLATDIAVQLATAGHVPEATNNLLRVQPLINECLDPIIAARLWQWLGRFGIEGRQPTSSSIAALERAAAMFNTEGRHRHVHACRRMIAEACIRSGDLARARRELELAETLELDEQATVDRMRRLRIAGLLADANGDPAAAIDLLEQAMNIAEARQIERYCLMLTADLAWVRLHDGGLDAAIEGFDRLLQRFEATPRQGLIRAYVLAGLTTALVVKGEIGLAAERAPSAITALRSCGTFLSHGDTFAWLAAAAGHPKIAALTLAATEVFQQRGETRRDPLTRHARDQAVQLVNAGLDEESRALHLREGAKLEEDVLAHLLERAFS